MVAIDDPGSPGRIPAGKTLCCGPIGSGTVSGVSRNLKAVGEHGPSRSAKGKAASSKMTCLEMMMRGEIKAAVSFVMVRIAEEDAQGRPGGEFVRTCGGQVGITFTAKNL
jgi:hypothetical protein